MISIIYSEQNENGKVIRKYYGAYSSDQAIDAVIELNHAAPENLVYKVCTVSDIDALNIQTR